MAQSNLQPICWTRMRNARDEIVKVQLYIDHHAILNRLGASAALSRGGKSQAMRGDVVVKVIKGGK